LNFEEFIKSRLRTVYVKEPGIVIYIRKCTLYRAERYGADFDLANMTAGKPGKGALSAFLDRYESKYGFYIEILQNERLVPYFQRRGYMLVPTSHPEAPDYYKRRP
jgi:hypothetical protein